MNLQPQDCKEHCPLSWAIVIQRTTMFQMKWYMIVTEKIIYGGGAGGDDDEQSNSTIKLISLIL